MRSVKTSAHARESPPFFRRDGWLITAAARTVAAPVADAQLVRLIRQGIEAKLSAGSALPPMAAQCLAYKPIAVAEIGVRKYESRPMSEPSGNITTANV